ncbi:MAG: hypothetical protein JWM12_4138 [Ilumatobacteraceae bacterium]|nr:hypothetical protein [Ilumatobacteraceae bacterium]
MAVDPAAVADILALRELALSYARHADRREPELLAALFEPDGELRMVRRGDPGPPAVSRGHRHIASLVARLRSFETTFHLVANHTIDIDGDDATGEVYCQAHHLTVAGDERTDHVMYIRYHDRYRRHGAGWSFVERELHVDWTDTHEVDPPT